MDLGRQCSMGDQTSPECPRPNQWESLLFCEIRAPEVSHVASPRSTLGASHHSRKLYRGTLPGLRSVFCPVKNPTQAVRSSHEFLALTGSCVRTHHACQSTP